MDTLIFLFIQKYSLIKALREQGTLFLLLIDKYSFCPEEVYSVDWRQDISKCTTTKDKSDKHHDLNSGRIWRRSTFRLGKFSGAPFRKAGDPPICQGNKSPARRSLLDKCYLCLKGHFIMNVYTPKFIINKFFTRCLVDFIIEIMIKRVI